MSVLRTRSIGPTAEPSSTSVLLGASLRAKRSHPPTRPRSAHWPKGPEPPARDLELVFARCIHLAQSKAGESSPSREGVCRRHSLLLRHRTNLGAFPLRPSCSLFPSPRCGERAPVPWPLPRDVDRLPALPSSPLEAVQCSGDAPPRPLRVQGALRIDM